MNLQTRTQSGSWRDMRAAWLHLHGLYANPFALGREPTAEFVDWQELTIDVGRIYSNVSNVDGPWVIYGGRGRGKTALCRVLQADCFPLQPNSKRLALLVGRDSLTRLVQACEHRLLHMDAIDLVAHVLLEACSRVEHWPVLGDQETAAEQSSQLRQVCDELAHACAVIHTRQAAQLGDIGRFSLLTDLLHRFEELLRRGGFTSFSLLIDEVSETAQLVAALGLAPLQLMTPLLAALEYLDPAWLKAVLFVPGEWKRPLEGQYLYARDKTYSKELEWNQDDLVEMLNRRLAFSTRATSRTPSFEALCDSDLRLSIYSELVAIASGRPRCALALAEQLLEEHCAVEPAQRYIARRTWHRVVANWPSRELDFASAEQHVRNMWDQLVMRVPTPAASPYSAGAVLEIKIDLDYRRVLVGGKPLDLGNKDYHVLAHLYEQREQLCPLDSIVAAAWPDEAEEGVSDAAIAQSIKRLRQALHKLAPRTEYIENKKGRGYILWPRGLP